MSPDRNDLPAVDRRAVLKSIGATSALAFSGIHGGVAAQGQRGPPAGIPPGQYEPDVDDLPEVKSAEVVVNEAGTVSKSITIDMRQLRGGGRGRGRGRGRARGQGAEHRSHKKYSLGLEMEKSRDAVDAFAQGRPDDVGVRAAVGKEERRVPARGVETHSHNDSGIDKLPDTGSKDYAAFGQTESQECSALARTTALADSYRGILYNTDADRESVSGDACVGHEWDETFEPFCYYINRYGDGDCSIPSAFNTTWRSPIELQPGSRAGTLFTCSNFPTISGTVLALHHVDLSDGPEVTFNYHVGVTPAIDMRDYGLDMQTFWNLLNDGLEAAFPIKRLVSQLAASLLLKHNSDVVS